jgi:antitoxin HicB
MTERLSFPAKLSPDDGSLLVKFRDFPEAITFGATEAEAISEAADCLEEAVAVRIAEGEPIPVPSRPRKGEKVVAVPAQMAAKAALYLAITEAAISRSELARRLGCDEKDVRRLLDPRHASRLTRLSAALAVLGKTLVVDVRDAA